MFRWSLYGSLAFPERLTYEHKVSRQWSSLLTSPSLGRFGTGETSRMSAWVSVEADGVVAVHTFPSFYKFYQILCPERGIIYGVMPSEWGRDLVILRANRIPSSSSVWYDYSLLHREPVRKCLGPFGDAQFVILLFKRKLEIWVMDEIPGLEKVSRLWK